MQADALVEAKQSAQEAESSQVHKEPVQREATDEIPFWIFQNAAGFGFGAGVFKKFGVVYARGAGGHAGETAEAEIHFIGKSFGRFEPAIGDRAHEGNAATRAVALEFGGVVSGAGRQAKAAMHALLEHRVI